MIESSLEFNVKIKGSKPCKMACRVFENQQASTDGQTWFFQHGGAHNSNCFDRLIAQIFAHVKSGHEVRRIICGDLPGRNGSGLAEGLKLGQHTLSDFADSVDQVLLAVAKKYQKLDVVLGHSMGGLILQILADRCKRRKTSFSFTYSTKKILLLAPVLPKELPWKYRTQHKYFTFAMSSLRWNPKLGWHFNFLHKNWKLYFCSDRKGQYSPQIDLIPMAEQESYYNRDSMRALFATVNFPPFWQPAVQRNSFVEDDLYFLSFEQDTFTWPEESQGLYKYLTADENMKHYKLLVGPEVSHNAFLCLSEQVAHEIYLLLNN
ncbi:MAG: alpha/beta hydrolase [Pseudobdellovibrionaceae bacterium]